MISSSIVHRFQDGQDHIPQEDDNAGQIHVLTYPITSKKQPTMAAVLPPLQTQHIQSHHHTAAPQLPQPPPVIPPQQRPAPVVDVRERVTVEGIPSQTVLNGQLVTGDDTSTSIRSYTPLKNVGDGSFGTVVLADWHSPLPPGVSISPMQLNIKYSSPQSNPATPLQMVAIKRMKKKWTGGWKECRQLKELESLRAIAPHPNVIPLYDSFLLPESKELYFIFECMEGNLYQLIKSRRGRPLAGGLVASVYRQVVDGLKHIHDSGYFHRDMKPENLLVTTTGLADYAPTSPNVPSTTTEKDVMVIVKLADFGLAREITSKPPYTEYVSTRWYRAPEVLLRSRDYGAPVDMWALGTILAELVMLKPLFPGQTEVDQVQKITEVLGNPTLLGEYGVDDRGRVKGGGDWGKGIRMGEAVGYRFKRTKPVAFHELFDRSVPPSLVDAIADLIRYDPTRRLTASECRTHPYWTETEHSQRGAIATQPTLSEHQAAAATQPQPRRRPSNIHIPPPDTSTSSNKSLRAAVESLELSQRRSRGLPQMSPRQIPPSHSHPLSPGHTKPAFADGSVKLPPLLGSQHRGPSGEVFSPITPSASPGLMSAGEGADTRYARSWSSLPGTSEREREREEMPPPVPPLPAYLRERGDASSVQATIGSDAQGDSMEISRSSLELDLGPPANQPHHHHHHQQGQHQQQGHNHPPQGGKFSLFKKGKSWFGHGQGPSASESPAAHFPHPPPIPASSTFPPTGSTSLKRGPSGSAGSINEFQSNHPPQPQPPPQQQQQPPPPLDAKAAKTLAKQARRDEILREREAQARRAKERSQNVIRKREDLVAGGQKNIEWDGVLDPTRSGAIKDHKGKAPNRSNPTPLPPKPDPGFLNPNQPGSYQYELQHQLHRHKARKRDADDDHSMSSSDVVSVSRHSFASYSTADSDPGPVPGGSRHLHHRMGLGFAGRQPYPPSASGNSSSKLNRATSAANLRSNTFSPSSTTSLEVPFDEMGLQQQTTPNFRQQQPGSLPAVSELHSQMNGGSGETLVSPPMQMLSLRASQSPPLPEGRRHGQYMSTLPPINSMNSPVTDYDDLGDTGGYGNLVSPSGQTLPPFSHIASWADQSNPRQYPSA